MPDEDGRGGICIAKCEKLGHVRKQFAGTVLGQVVADLHVIILDSITFGAGRVTYTGARPGRLHDDGAPPKHGGLALLLAETAYRRRSGKDADGGAVVQEEHAQGALHVGPIQNKGAPRKKPRQP